MNLRKLQTELAAALQGFGYTVYDDALKAAAGAQLPAVVVGIPDEVVLLNKVRANVSLPVHVLLSTADSADALQRLSDAIEFRNDKDSIFGGIMSATSNYWQSIYVDGITGFALVTVGANQTALACDINITISAIQVAE